ncbi:unnamed protein product [Prunus brigantina]
MSTTSQNFDPLPIFMGGNYDFWSIQMKTYFMSQDLWDIVDSGFNNPENPTVEQLRQLKKDQQKVQQKDAKALYALQQALHDTIFPRIMGATTAREAWNTLKEEFQGNAKNMMRDLPNIKEIHDVCEGCQLGKQHRQAFPSGKAWRAKALLELVHTDVCGPMRTPSLDNNSSQSKGYRIYNPKTKKFMISRDVEFDESASWNWKEEKVENKSVTITQPCREETEETPGTIPQPTTPPAIQDEGSPKQRTRSLQDIYETCNFITIEPESFEVAVKEEIWRKAMEEEIKTIEKNKTWELVDRPKDKEIIGVKWVYKTKFNPDGSI